MKLVLFIVFAGLSFPLQVSAQKYSLDKSSVTFFSDATIEDITARNTKATGIFNSATGDIVFSIPIKEFQFAKTLMQEHFNEKYMETEKFPKSTFQGKITGFNPDTKGVQEVRAVGKMLIHGETKEIDVPGTIEASGKNMIMKSKFMVVLEDYNIKRPQLMWQNIAEQVELTLEFTFKPM